MLPNVLRTPNSYSAIAAGTSQPAITVQHKDRQQKLIKNNILDNAYPTTIDIQFARDMVQGIEAHSRFT